MLLPLPEIKMAPRRESRMVRRGPVPVGVPRPGTAADGAATRAGFDAADLECAAKRVRYSLRTFRIDDYDHADAAIEGARHFLRRNPAALLQQLEDRGLLPPAYVDHRMATLGQNPRNILEKTSAGDVRQALDLSLLHQGKELPDVDNRGFQQRSAERLSKAGEVLFEVP